MINTHNRILDLGTSYPQLPDTALPREEHLTGLLLFLGVCALWAVIIYLAIGAL
jgi:hypothetical protein